VKNLVKDIFSCIKNAQSSEEKILAIEKTVSASLFRSLKNETVKNKQKFIDLFCAFDEKQEDFFLELPHDKPSDKHVKELLADGATKVSGLMPKKRN